MPRVRHHLHQTRRLMAVGVSPHRALHSRTRVRPRSQRQCVRENPTGRQQLQLSAALHCLQQLDRAREHLHRSWPSMAVRPSPPRALRDGAQSQWPAQRRWSPDGAKHRRCITSTGLLVAPLYYRRTVSLARYPTLSCAQWSCARWHHAASTARVMLFPTRVLSGCLQTTLTSTACRQLQSCTVTGANLARPPAATLKRRVPSSHHTRIIPPGFSHSPPASVTLKYPG